MAAGRYPSSLGFGFGFGFAPERAYPRGRSGYKSRGSWLVASSRADDFVANVSGQDLWLTQSSVALAFPLQFESVAYFRVRFVGRSRRVVAFDSWTRRRKTQLTGTLQLTRSEEAIPSSRSHIRVRVHVHDAGRAQICTQQQAADAVALDAAQRRKSRGLYFSIWKFSSAISSIRSLCAVLLHADRLPIPFRCLHLNLSFYVLTCAAGHEFRWNSLVSEILGKPGKRNWKRNLILRPLEAKKIFAIYKKANYKRWF